MPLPPRPAPAQTAALPPRSCGTCAGYDPMSRGLRETGTGWCSKKSIYPAIDEAHHPSPEGVKRAARSEPAKPVIVERREVVAGCPLYVPQRTHTREALLDKARGTK